jgi:hypothetical protein
MEEEFVPYEIALNLREKGFDKQCFAYFDGEKEIQPIDTDFKNFRSIGECIAAPLWQQVIDWFREKRNIHIVIARNDKDLVDFATSRGVTTMLLYRWYFVDCYINVGGAAESYHEARQAVIEKAITLI